MGLTRLKAIVNMNSFAAELKNWERGDPPVRVDPFSAKSIDNWAIPWCRSQGEFPGHHLTLLFPVTGGGTRTEYQIWQENILGVDAVRFTLNGQYERPDTAPPRNSRFLASERSGGIYNITGDTEAILVIDERSWVILYKIGTR